MEDNDVVSYPHKGCKEGRASSRSKMEFFYCFWERDKQYTKGQCDEAK